MKDHHDEEIFDSFLSYFKSDSAFQLTRTEKPYIISCEFFPTNFSPLEILDTLITSEDVSQWSPLTLDGKYEKLEANNDSILLMEHHSDFFPPVTYYNIFVKRNGKWFYKTFNVEPIRHSMDPSK